MSVALEAAWLDPGLPSRAWVEPERLAYIDPTVPARLFFVPGPPYPPRLDLTFILDESAME